MGLFTKDNSKENTYYITVIETLKKVAEVNAETEEEAMAKVEEAYNKCKIILDENDFTDVKFKLKKVIKNEEEDNEVEEE